jgi:hypothetical protein
MPVLTRFLAEIRLYCSRILTPGIWVSFCFGLTFGCWKGDRLPEGLWRGISQGAKTDGYLGFVLLKIEDLKKYL